MELNFFMPKFALKNIEAVKGKQRFDKLVVDGVCLFDQFEEEMKIQYSNEIATLYAYMNEVANLRTLPYEKFHPYDKNDPRGWEFKTKHLRVYCVEQRGGKIVVLGGQKSKQANDESNFHYYQKLLGQQEAENKKTKCN